MANEMLVIGKVKFKRFLESLDYGRELLDTFQNLIGNSKIFLFARKHMDERDFERLSEIKINKPFLHYKRLGDYLLLKRGKRIWVVGFDPTSDMLFVNEINWRRLYDERKVSARALYNFINSEEHVRKFLLTFDLHVWEVENVYDVEGKSVRVQGDIIFHFKKVFKSDDELDEAIWRYAKLMLLMDKRYRMVRKILEKIDKLCEEDIQFKKLFDERIVVKDSYLIDSMLNKLLGELGVDFNLECILLMRRSIMKMVKFEKMDTLIKKYLVSHIVERILEYGGKLSTPSEKEINEQAKGILQSEKILRITIMNNHHVKLYGISNLEIEELKISKVGKSISWQLNQIMRHSDILTVREQTVKIKHHQHGEIEMRIPPSIIDIRPVAGGPYYYLI